MSPVEFKKRPCRPVEFKGQGLLPTPLTNTKFTRPSTSATGVGLRD